MKWIIFFIGLIMFISCGLALDGWNFQINSEIAGNDFIAKSSFIGAVSQNSVTGLDLGDGQMVETPAYGIPLYSKVEGLFLMLDSRKIPNVGENITWYVFQSGSREFRRIGSVNENITWDLSNLPSNIDIILVDYTDGLFGERIISSINLRNEVDYSFDVSNPYGEYRNFKVIAIVNPIASDLGASTGGGSSGSGAGGVVSSGGVTSNYKYSDNFSETVNNKNSSRFNLDNTFVDKSNNLPIIMLSLLVVFMAIFFYFNRRKRHRNYYK